MTTTVVRRQIDAPADLVFHTVADIENFSKAIPHILRVEFLSDIHQGLGTRFRETRDMNGREATTELEVTEYTPTEKVRLVADSHGTVWDTTFTVSADSQSTVLEMVMDARAHTLLPKLLNPLMKPLVKRAIEKDMDAVKAYCESQNS